MDTELEDHQLPGQTIRAAVGGSHIGILIEKQPCVLPWTLDGVTQFTITPDFSRALSLRKGEKISFWKTAWSDLHTYLNLAEQQHYLTFFILYCSFPGGASGKEPACQCRVDVWDAGSILGSGRSPGGQHCNPLQCYCPENPMDRGAWWVAVHRVTESETWQKQLSKHSHSWLTSNFVIVSDEQQRDSAIQILVSILLQTPLPSRQPHNTEQSSVSCTIGPWWLSILSIAVCTCPSKLSHYSFSPSLSPATISSFSKSGTAQLFFFFFQHNLICKTGKRKSDWSRSWSTKNHPTSLSPPTYTLTWVQRCWQATGACWTLCEDLWGRSTTQQN